MTDLSADRASASPAENSNQNRQVLTLLLLPLVASLAFLVCVLLADDGWAGIKRLIVLFAAIVPVASIVLLLRFGARWPKAILGTVFSLAVSAVLSALLVALVVAYQCGRVTGACD